MNLIPLIETIINWVRRLTPDAVLEWNRNRKKQARNKALRHQQEKGAGYTIDFLVNEIKKMGIHQGDVLLVHSAMSKIGYVEGGAKTVIEAFLKVIGPQGTLVMPSSPVDKLQLDYAKSKPTFDVIQTPSKMGVISETFRKMEGVKRSLHPTEPVCALGSQANFLTETHHLSKTTYDENSPWFKLTKVNAKILYLGVTLINSGTSLHVLEDAVDFKYPVYYKDKFTFKVIDESGTELPFETVVHNPEYSAKRKCDHLIPMFEKEAGMKRFSLGQAECLFIEASPMLETMLKAYHKKGVTMYTPFGN